MSVASCNDGRAAMNFVELAVSDTGIGMTAEQPVLNVGK
jgi:signal transduction histidine kinase